MRALLTSVLLLLTTAAAAQDELLIADFEGLDYGRWAVEGEAFGPGPAEGTLDRQMNVSGYRGKRLVNVDHIVQSNRAMTLPPEELQKTILLEKQFLNLPVKNGAAKRRMELLIDGKAVRAFDIELAPDESDWWAPMEIADFRGKQGILKVDAMEPGSGGLNIVDQTGQIKGHETLYDEPLRPQFHFSQQRGWNNDPNGMVFYDGEYHLFFQHNPYGWRWANMHWGHAVSRDMVHWKQLPEALYPWTQAVAHCFSGSGTVDEANTARFQTGDEKVIIAAFTDTGCGEAIAYSNDRGRTFTYYEGNPVVEHKGRDPRVFWYKPGSHWVMAVYDEEGSGDKTKRRIAFYISPNLKEWELQSKLDGFYECPEIFELPIDGNPANTRWVVFAADAKYVIGRFDGKKFTPEHEGKHQVHWGRYYASQTFDRSPDGRRIQIGWGRIDMEGMPFNQMMTFPCELTLRTTADGVRMFARPIREIELLHENCHPLKDVVAGPEKPVVVPTSGRLFDIRAELTLGDAKRFGLKIGDRTVVYDVAASTLDDMPLAPVDGKIRLQILIDRPSIEICGNDGRVMKTDSFRSQGPIESIRVFSEEGSVTVDSLEVYELNSAWK